MFDHAETGETKARFPWKKRLEWMPRDVPWPPPGKSLKLFFRPPSSPPTALAGPVLLKEHLPHYEQRLANLFGAGIQACCRGPRLYDAPETEALVKKWASFYKAHREALDVDLIHLRRSDGRDWDVWLHVNPNE